VQKRDRVLTLRLNNEEYRRFEGVAEDRGLNVSDTIRALMREEEKKQGTAFLRDYEAAKAKVAKKAGK